MSPKNPFIKGPTVPIKPMPTKNKPVLKRFAPEPPKTSKLRKPYLILILVVAMGLSAAYLLIKGMNVTDKSIEEGGAFPQKQTQQDIQEEADISIIDKVKRHIIVNESETPYVATISNIDLVRSRNPVFYKDASQGDKVLIWSDKAVIYSESLDKLVAVTTALPPSFDGATSTPQLVEDGDGEGEEPEDTETEILDNVSVEIRNGTRVAGAASRLRTELTNLGLDVERIGDAANAYEGTRIVDLTGGRAVSAIQTIVDATQGTVFVEMPEGEPETGSDILVIIGR